MKGVNDGICYSPDTERGMHKYWQLDHGRCTGLQIAVSFTHVE